MADEELQDVILGMPLPDGLIEEFKEAVSKFPYTTNVLQALEEYLKENGDGKAARLVEQATLKVCAYEAEGV